jgi:hypothetical protein
MSCSVVYNNRVVVVVVVVEEMVLGSYGRIVIK